MVKKNGLELENLPIHFKKDREIVLAAVRSDGFAIVDADSKFLDDNKIVRDTGKIIYAHMNVNNREINLYNFSFCCYFKKKVFNFLKRKKPDFIFIAAALMGLGVIWLARAYLIGIIVIGIFSYWYIS